MLFFICCFFLFCHSILIGVVVVFARFLFCFLDEKKYTNGLKSGCFPRSVGTPLSLVRYICVSKSGFLYNVRLVVYLSRRRGKERFCYSSTLVYISSVLFLMLQQISCHVKIDILLLLFFLVVFFFSSLKYTQSIEWSYNVSKIPLRPGFILAINSNSIRKMTTLLFNVY